ncbi:MAG: efflux RND transporter periplasmic adaptor subunit [Bacteroidales bacterium]|jgi:RND family efflux transporter MFP subunit
MKILKKYSIILIILVIVALVVFRLFGNKAKMDTELKQMSEYSSVIPIEVITPEVQESSVSIEENGVTRSGAEINILSETAGKVVYVYGKPGDHVSVGQTLVKVEKEVVESQYKLAKLNMENAERDNSRFSNLAGGDAITQQQLEAAKLNLQNAQTTYTAAYKQLQNTEIKSTVNGVIAKRMIEIGDNLLPTLPVFSVLERNRMIFLVKLAESDLNKISRGQKAELTLDAIKGKVFRGEVQTVGVVADMSGRYDTEIKIFDQDKNLRSGLSGKVRFSDVVSYKGVTIPRKCITGSINNASVYLLQGDSVISRKVLATSIDDTKVLVTEGLGTNEKVVLTGQINLQDGTKVRVLNK